MSTEFILGSCHIVFKHFLNSRLSGFETACHLLAESEWLGLENWQINILSNWT